jgi:hypothetical protein
LNVIIKKNFLLSPPFVIKDLAENHFRVIHRDLIEKVLMISFRFVFFRKHFNSMNE